MDMAARYPTRSGRLIHTVQRDSNGLPHMRSRPVLKVMLEGLKSIVDWQTLMINMEMKKHEIDKIKANNPLNVEAQKQDAFEKWLRQTPDACWKQVIDALYQMDENFLATEMSKRYEWRDPRVYVTDSFVEAPQHEEIRIAPMGTKPCRRFLPKLTPHRDYFTLSTSLPSAYEVSQETVAFFTERMEKRKPNLTDFLRSIEKSDSKGDFIVGIEARFGKIYWQLDNHASVMIPPRPVKEMRRYLKKRSFNPEVSEADVEFLFKDRKCTGNEITRVPRVVCNEFIVEGQYAGNYIAVVGEHGGTFYLDAVYRKQPVEKRARYDIALPGRKYDFRIGDCSAPLLLESEHSVPCKIARDITASMHRLPERKLSLTLRGETKNKETTWTVTYIRQRKQKQYHWKPDKKWILVLYDIDVFDSSTNQTVQIETVPVNESVNIPEFNYSRKEVELWGLRIFPREVNRTAPSREKCYYMESIGGVKLPGEHPIPPYEWTAEDLMKDFEEFVGDAFKIAAILNSSPS